MENKSTRIVAIALVAVMLGTGALYLTVASDEYKDQQQEAQAAEAGENEANERGENEQAASPEQPGGFGDMGEVVFFTIIGATYIPVGLWMLKRKDTSRKPYIIALI
ncbi:MAG: hypothetical protein EB163_07435, partial [Nitrososphaeria archaeon]|nr:hypothetical protein [Nitrososphaeria archaeon]